MKEKIIEGKIDVNLASIYEKIECGHYEEALSMMNQYKQIATDEELFSLAELYQQLGFSDEGLELIIRLVKKYPTNSSLLLAKSEALIDLGKEEEAISVLYSIEKIDENYVSSLLLLADIYEMQGLTEVSEQKLLEAYGQDPKSHLLSFALAEFYTAEKEPVKAIQFYEEVLKETDTVLDTNIHLQIGKALSECGKYEKALHHFEKGLTKKIELDSLFQAGMTAFYSEKYELAIQYLKELQSLDCEYTTLYYYLAKSYQEIGALKEMKEMVQMGLYYDQHNARLSYLAAEIAHHEADEEKEEEYLQQVLQIEENHHEAFSRLLEMWNEQQAYEKMMKKITTSTEAKEIPLYMWYLARAYVELERYDEALTTFQKAAPFFQEDEGFLGEYAEFLIEEGRREEALTCLKKIVTINPLRTDIFDYIDRIEFDDF